MSVPEQIPTVSYTANGTTTNFPITFELSDERYLVVTKNMEIPPVGAYTVLNGNVIFGVAPNEGDIITLMRDTVLDRETNYQNYDNSFRPEAVNYDLDKIWHVLQEQNLIDAKLLARLKEEIEWRRTHDANFDELALMRDSQVFTGLKQYVDTYIAATNPNIFDGITAGIVFALDGKSIQTHIELIYADLLAARADIDAEIERATLAESLLTDNLANEVLRATTVEQNIQTQVNALGTGNKAYLTYADMDADKTNIPANSKVTVTNDATSSNNGDWQWSGTSFTKSVYDPLTLSKTYTNAEIAKGKTETLNIVDLKLEGGDLALITGTEFTFDGYINTTGAFVSSGAGYKATDFIYVESAQTIKSSLHAGNTVSTLAFYDKDKAFISSVLGNSSLVERLSTIPANACFIRISNLPSSQPSPYCNVTYISEILNDSDLTLTPSENLAHPSLIVTGSYVNTSGGISVGAGWKHIKIPVTPNEHYTFGNFIIDTAGFFTFLTASNAAIAGSNGSYQTGTMPRTVIAPATAGFLLFDIARPSNLPEHHAQVMCNVGDSLLSYVDPESTVSAIKGKKINGVGGGGTIPENVVVQDSDAILADVTVDTLTTAALIANLPTSPSGLPSGRAYIDVAAGNVIKVV